MRTLSGQEIWSKEKIVAMAHDLALLAVKGKRLPEADRRRAEEAMAERERMTDSDMITQFDKQLANTITDTLRELLTKGGKPDLYHMTQMLFMGEDTEMSHAGMVHDAMKMIANVRNQDEAAKAARKIITSDPEWQTVVIAEGNEQRKNAQLLMKGESKGRREEAAIERSYEKLQETLPVLLAEIANHQWRDVLIDEKEEENAKGDKQKARGTVGHGTLSKLAHVQQELLYAQSCELEGAEEWLKRIDDALGDLRQAAHARKDWPVKQSETDDIAKPAGREAAHAALRSLRGDAARRIKERRAKSSDPSQGPAR